MNKRNSLALSVLALAFFTLTAHRCCSDRDDVRPRHRCGNGTDSTRTTTTTTPTRNN